MTLSECDSTTYIEPFFQDNSHHADGCTRIGAPCSGSLLRLALVAGSAYAVRFTTCVVKVSSSRRRVERTKQPHPYRRKSKHSKSVLRPISPNVQSDRDVSSSPDLSFGDNTGIESAIERQVIDNFQPGLSKTLHSDEMQNSLQSTRVPLVPHGIISEAEGQRPYAEK